MFSGFKSRGFGVEDTHIQHPDRLARLLLVMVLALDTAVSTGPWDAETNPTPAEKRPEASAQKGGLFKDIILYQRLTLYCPPHPQHSAASASLDSKN